MRERKCACGHTRGHREVAQDPEYTLWGWIQLSMLGITPLPERIVFRCRRCQRSLGVSRDPALLRKRGMPDPLPDPAPPPDPAAAAEPAPAAEPGPSLDPAATEKRKGDPSAL
jgi:hypothetical protein